MIDLHRFNEKKATHVVSLGSECRVTHNLRRFFDFGNAYPFDWWGTEANSLELFLSKPDIDALYDVDNLELSSDRRSIVNREFNINLHHEFPRDFEGNIRSDWKCYIDPPKSRTQALMERFFHLNSPGNRIAFFRNREINKDLLILLHKRFNLADFTFIHLDVNDNSVDWWGDQKKWDNALSLTGIILDKGSHKPFKDEIESFETIT